MKALSSTKSQLAIPFITYNEKQGFSLNPEAEQFIRQISQNKKLGIISIVGKYRTGKSFFVNRVLLNSRKCGFQVGPTINPCTKGLWIWKKTLTSLNPEHQNMEILLIDTQGFGGMDENTNHDSRIFLFSLLLSSYFIYNSVGSIDENALNTLNLITNLAKDIQSKTGGKTQQIPSHFPAFLWVVRDFTLQLVDKMGNKVTSKQYLQNALQLIKGVSDSAQNKNKIRRAFKHFFQDRDCVTMFRPTEDEKELQRLDQIDNSQLRPEFLAQMQSVRKKIFTKIKPKSLNNKTLNGSMLVELIKGYIQAINKGALPNIQNAWVYVCRNEGMKALNQSIKSIQKKILTITNNNPIEEKQIQDMKKQWREQALKQFKSRSLNSEQSYPQFLEKLENKINNLVNDFKQTNKRNWEYKYRQISDKVADKIKDKIFSEGYRTYNQFLEDFSKLKDEYEKQAGNSQEKWIYFNQVSENIHKLAGETITNKINQTLQVEKQLLQQKMSLKQEQFVQKKKEYQQQKQLLRTKIEQLQKYKAKISTTEQCNLQRLRELKQQKEKYQNKCNQLELINQERKFQIEKLKKETQKNNAFQIDELRSELKILRSNMQKQKVLNQMEKNYHEKQVNNFKQKISYLQTENKKYKNTYDDLNQQNENLNNVLKQKKIQINQYEQQKQSLLEKIESLLLDNKKKSELLKDQNQWLLEKSYLENQITFLRNTVNQNKRLHDALVVALQQNSNSSEADKINELMQTNKNLSLAYQKLETRCKSIEEKQQNMKKYKKIVKNSIAFQCLHCNKLISHAIITQHLQSCGQDAPTPSTTMTKHNQKINTKQNLNTIDASSLTIVINQTLMKQLQQNKPYTQYLIQVSFQNKKWSITRKFKSFCELQQNLLNSFPSIKFPESSNTIFNIHTDINQIINSKRTTAVQQRKKALQTFIRDLAKIDQIRNSKIFKQFLKIDEHIQTQNSSSTKQLIEQIPNYKGQHLDYEINSIKKQTPYKSIFSSSKHKKH